MPEWLMCGATVTANGLLKQQGQRAYGLLGFSVKRGNYEVMDDLTEREIAAGDWWLFDDVSQNHPFWFQKIDADADDDAARKQQVTICRQSLMCMDLRSGRWLGCELIGRSRDSYRAEDILRFFFRLFALYGLPRRGIILERGIWKCKVIAGGRVVEVEMSEEEKERVVGGLRQLGILVKHAHDAKGKGCIESGFRHFQNLCAGRIEGLYIGRKRGDRENGMKQFMRAHRGVVHPGKIGMLHIDHLSLALTQIMEVFNAEKKEGEIQNGVPEQAWQRSIKANPLPPMPEDKVYLFMPVQRELTIRGGHVETTVQGRVLRFTNPAEFAIMGERYRVRIHFDASEPALGAWIFNAETSTLNRERHKVGQYLCRAEHAPDAPQYAPPGWMDDNIRNRKAYNGAVRVAFCAPGTFGYGRVSASEERNGSGNVARIERGASAGFHNAAQTATVAKRAKNDQRADELRALANAQKEAARVARTPKVSAEELELADEREGLKSSAATRLLTDAEEQRLKALDTKIGLLKKSRGEIDSDYLARRQAAAKRQLGIFS